MTQNSDRTSVADVEQARLDLERDDPRLYAYIAHSEAAKALDKAGDCISTHDAAANIVWALSSEQQRKADRVA